MTRLLLLCMLGCGLALAACGGKDRAGEADSAAGPPDVTEVVGTDGDAKTGDALGPDSCVPCCEESESHPWARECGDNCCGGSCGDCPEGSVCADSGYGNRVCFSYDECPAVCGEWGASCGQVAPFFESETEGEVVCDCGGCAEGEECTGSLEASQVCCPTCATACAQLGRECGEMLYDWCFPSDAGIDGACDCGECPDGQICVGEPDSASYCCTPDCDGKQCGEDGCGGNCGECDDGLDCTDDICDVGVCEPGILLPSYCLIQGECHQSGDVDPAESCMGCRPELSTTSWSELEDGAECEVSWSTGYCQAGYCCDTADWCLDWECGCGAMCGGCWPPCDPPEWWNGAEECCLETCGGDCCYEDKDCEEGLSCAYLPTDGWWADGDSMGRCVASPTYPQCWNKGDCAEGEICFDATYCDVPCSAPCPTLAPGTCMPPFCGDGTCDSDESCEDCPADCGPCPVCGNGLLEMGEGCDDGNLESGDGCGPQCKSEEWCPVAASQELSYDVVWVRDESSVFVSASDGSIKLYDGSSWAVTFEDDWLYVNSMFGFGPADIYAAAGLMTGSKYPVLHFDGLGWSEIVAGDELCTGQTEFLAIWGPDASHVFLVGENVWTDKIVLCRPEAGQLKLVTILAETGYWDVSDMWGPGLDQIFVAGHGSSHNLLHLDGDACTEETVVYADTYLWAIWGSGPGDVFAAGYDYAGNEGKGFLAHYDGEAWTEMAEAAGSRLTSLWGTGPSDVYAVGYDGVILHYDGDSWSPMISGTQQTLYDVHGSGQENIWAVGQGVVLHRGTPCD